MGEGHRYRRSSGFTLIEVTLAIVLATALVGAMLWFYRHTAETRDSVNLEIQRVTARRMIMEKMTGELRGSLAYEFLNLGLDGTLEEVTFITASLPGEAAWAVRNITEDPIPPEQDLQLVTYGLRIEEDENGDSYIAGLEQKSQKIIAAQTAEEGDEIKSRLLSPNILFLRFRYHDGSEWLPEWTEGKLPRAVEVSMGEQPLPEGVEPEEYPYELARRVIYMPGSVAPQQNGNIIRGLGLSLGGGR